MPRYAESTKVNSAQSRAEIERTLERYGATAFGYSWADRRATITFTIGGRDVAMTLPMPDRRSPEFTLTPGRRLVRSDEQAAAAYEQGVQQRWRALVLVVKAKLEAVEAGISTVEREFLADVVIEGRTVGDYVQPKIVEYYAGRELEGRT